MEGEPEDGLAPYEEDLSTKYFDVDQSTGKMTFVEEMVTQRNQESETMLKTLTVSKHKTHSDIMAIKTRYFESQKLIVEKYLKKPRVYNPELKSLMKGFFVGNQVSGVEQGEGLFFWNDGYAFEGIFDAGKVSGNGIFGYLPEEMLDVRFY